MKRKDYPKATERFKRTQARAASQPKAGPAWFPLSIVALTLVAFFPTLQNGFVDWDDYGALVQNPHYRGLGWSQIRWMFTTFYMNHYQPLSWMTLGLDYLLWGMAPLGYHLTNLILHAANGVLFYFLTVRLLMPAIPNLSADPQAGRAAAGESALRLAAGLAALSFAVHPLRVESVAWVTERRDVLSGLFFLGTLLCYLRAAALEEEDPGRRRWMVRAAIVYGLSLLSKASGMTLPFILLILDVYPLRRLGGERGRWLGPEVRRVWLEKAPFLVLALIAMIVAARAQHQTGAMISITDYGLSSRLAQALFGLVFYLWKTILPVGLSPIYEIRTDFSLSDWPFLLSALGVAAITIPLFRARRFWPAGLACWIYYLMVLAPVLGFAQSGPQAVADRYSYLSCLSWAALFGGGLFYCWRAWTTALILGRTFALVVGLAVAFVAGLGTLTWRQAAVWRDTERLWTHALAVNPNSRVAHTNLGKFLTGRGEPERALEHFRAAVESDPRSADAHYNLGVMLANRDDVAGAIEHFRRALQLDPDSAEGHYNMGAMLAAHGELRAAREHLEEALRIDPRLPEARELLRRMQGRN